MSKLRFEHRRLRLLAAWVAGVVHMGVAGPSVAQIIPLASEFQVSQSTSICAANPQVVPRSDGGFVVVWGDGNAQSIRWRAFDVDANPLNAEQSLQDAASNLTFEDVATVPAGDLVVVWTVDNEGSQEIRGRRFASSGAALGADFAVSGATSQVNDADLAIDDQGHFIVAWTENSYGSYSLEARRFGSDGSPMGSQFTVSGSNNPSQADVAKQVESGEFVIVWQELASGSTDIFAQRFQSSGVPMGSRFVVNTFTTGYQQSPAVALATSGDFVVSWSGPTNTSAGDDRASLALVNSSNVVLANAEIGSSMTQQGSTSLAASLDGGSFAVGMNDLTGTAPFAYDIRAAFNAAFDQSVASIETGDQKRSAVAIDEADRATIVWETDPDDNLCFDIAAARGQLYRILPPGTFLGRIHGRSQQSAWKYYLFSPPQPGDYEIVLSGLTNDADLYVQIGDLPDLDMFQCRPFQGGVNSETCVANTDGTAIGIAINGFASGLIEFSLDIAGVPPLFVDGFESGDTLAWSATVTP